MRKSLKEIQQIEAYQFNEMPASKREEFEHRLVLNPTLSEQTYWQRKTYTVLRYLFRKRLRSELQVIEKQLFCDPKHQTFQEKIRQIFGRSDERRATRDE